MGGGIHDPLSRDKAEVIHELWRLLEHCSKMADLMSELHQIYYNETQLPKLFPFAIPYKNPGLTIFFENTPIVEIVKSTSAEKVGVCSWKLADKMRIRVGMRRPLTPEVLDSDFQVLSLTKNSSRHTMLAMANAWHPKFRETITLLWQKLGLKLPGEAKNPIYQNHYCAKTEIYRDYVDNFLSPAMELTEKDEELHNLMTQPSGYGKLNRSADVKSVKEKLGLDDYPLAPFILERSPCLYFQMKGIQITYL
jgi:hypothetical protein